MRFSWPEDTEFTRLDLEVEDRSCPACNRHMSICDHRRHPIFTLNGPTELVCKLVHCPDASCASRPKTFSPLAETAITLPYWLIGWDVFCWIGHRRFTHHWSIPQLLAELIDSYEIPLSHDALGLYIKRYQTMLAARQQDAQVLAEEYHGVDSLILSIDGLQPEKGHETLYVVRELTRKRAWFAEALISSTAFEIQRLIAKARQWAEQLGIPVQLWVSDKQDAFLTGIAAEFAGVPHRYCSNHFMRDLAKPILDTDSNAKVKMRSKVRGLRSPGAPGCCDSNPQRQSSKSRIQQPPWLTFHSSRRSRRAGIPTTSRWTPPARSCSIIAQPFVESSTAIRAVPCSHLVYAWPRPSMRFATPSKSTWRKKRGLGSWATPTARRLHRPRLVRRPGNPATHSPTSS